ncbi:MAG: 50S ribosomal protein L18 [Candidatus Terrybacteria bacterium RIFCSPLOWO2_01_FULL_44_24]|uniref:Large ribosomal subunit protein uL18 n=1 Tax=Candidatus Terrybacteria bacterium RIFCSPHIGHO2_01_FULL_43_35 TaxID=1802361 RepID=A0A1G2PD20_9BACT|nr:MAG: 50S ribosomal protein L18 [Candidatus Terrybacteria bacterium RIFCSPHIGHO2_01_FULL_43_35]OHA49419.1 MAG: 50S ribosomal protein L18 [Candidatus Terrybacteria bacterium RIFCSPHIGHO2_02_FULL_43_14]OHA51646.1 MAG: 50S ribosomal protein L18 [Candidatus Terrybacteria bacterium RIFCSPLOWO2_01_FULL_44_24]
MKITASKRITRHRRIRAKISGSPTKPRLSVFRSNKHISAQIIVDSSGTTLVSAHDNEIKISKSPRKTAKKDKSVPGTKINVAHEVGKIIAAKALAKKINSVVFDRGGYAYHGQVRALAEGAREGGLKF